MSNSNALKSSLSGFIIAVIIVLSFLTVFLLLETVFPEIQNKGYFDSGLSLTQYVNPTYQFTSPIIFNKEIIIVPVTEIYSNGTHNEIDLPLKATIEQVFESTALSAQNPITVYTKVIFSIPDNSNIDLHEEYYMLFPFSQDISKKRPMFDDTQGMIVLKKINKIEFFGSGKIMYPFEGVQPFFKILKLDEILKTRVKDTGYVTGLNLTETIDGRSFLTIEPSSTTTILRTNVIIVALTFVVIAFGLTQIRRTYLQ